MADKPEGFACEVIKLGDVCRRIDVSYRDARFVLASGMIPLGLKLGPGRGHHRLFNHRQAVWMAIVLMLKAAGIKTRLAADVANWAERFKGYARDPEFDLKLSPFDGAIAAFKGWFLDVGDARCVRIMTDTDPARSGIVDISGWVNLKTKKLTKKFNPVVLVRVDLSQVVRRLHA